MSSQENKLIKELIIKVSQEIGFTDIRFLAAQTLFDAEEKFIEWRNKGYAADMQYLLKENPINARPTELLKEAKTIIMFTAHYYSPCPPRPSDHHGRIASYAVGLDYHKVLRKKIQDLINHPELKPHFAKSKFFTDAVPLLEKSFAKKAGLGFRGRNTLLISRETGSFNFILEILTDLELEPDDGSSLRAERSEAKQSPNLVAGGSPRPFGARDDITCGNCTRCMDICPTNALPSEYQLDARKCISYHTIENRGEIPQELATKFGEWFFGCDLCQTICPYNRMGSSRRPSTLRSDEAPQDDNFIRIFPEFRPDSGFGHWIYLPEILDLEENKHANFSSLLSSLENHKFIRDDDFKIIKNKFYKQLNAKPEPEDLDFIFQVKFAQTPLLRPKRTGLIRNAKIVLSS